jgi:hypothetical protein
MLRAVANLTNDDIKQQVAQTVIGFSKLAGQDIFIPPVLQKVNRWIRRRIPVEEIADSDALDLMVVDPHLLHLTEWWTIPEPCQIFDNLSSRLGVNCSDATVPKVRITSFSSCGSCLWHKIRPTRREAIQS